MNHYFENLTQEMINACDSPGKNIIDMIGCKLHEISQTDAWKSAPMDLRMMLPMIFAALIQARHCYIISQIGTNGGDDLEHQELTNILIKDIAKAFIKSSHILKGRKHGLQ